jgi:transcriptional antiterminator
MYRIVKVLNHNAVLAVNAGDNTECLLMGKGIGFGKKISERVEPGKDTRIYVLQACHDSKEAGEIVKSIDPEFLEVANLVLNEAERVFGHIDRNILFPLADHIFYAVERMKKNEQISNPLTEDIRLLFHMEYKVAGCAVPVLREKFGVCIGDDEVGYITLHIHSAIDDDNVSDAMKTAQAVRECVRIVEGAIGKPIDVLTLSYNRLMNHVRYMIVRAQKGEKLKMSLNDYMSVKYSKEFAMAETICGQIGNMIGYPLKEAEIGYLAMHICRVINNELDVDES